MSEEKQAASNPAEQALADLIERVNSGADAAVQLGGEHIPDVVTQLLWWHGVSSALYGLIGLAIVWIVVHFYVKQLKRVPVDPNDPQGNIKETLFLNRHGNFDDDAAFAVTVVSGILCIIGVALMINLITTMQVLVAPKLYLLEYGAQLVN